MPVLEIETRRASLLPASLDREAGTVEAVLSRGAAVRRSGWTEILAVAPENVTVAARLPVLDAHRQTSIADIKGRVVSVRFEDGAIIATLRISDPAALDAIARGDVTGVSIGYRVTRWAESSDPETRARIRTAIDWELLEVSLVPIPADPAAILRSDPLQTETTQTETETPAALDTETRTAIRQIARSAGLESDWADARIDSGSDLTSARAAAFEAMQARSETIRTATVGASSEDPAVIRQRQTEALAARMGGPEASDGARVARQLIESVRRHPDLRGVALA